MKLQTIYQQGQKPNQEDSLFPLEGEAKASDRIFLVCDGMGGHENGEVASKIVADTVGKLTTASGAMTIEQMRRAFENALSMAYDELDKADNTDSVKKMGTTLTFAAWCEDGILVAHIGDSRVYQFRPGQGIIFQTRDHSLVNDLIAAGELTPEEARTFPQRNVITRALQPHQEYRTKAAFNVISDVRKGDIFMLCSDGIVEQIENSELEAILLADKPLADKCDDLREECAQRQTRDNHSCYLIEADEDIVAARTITPNSGPTITPTLVPSAPEAKKISVRWILIFAAVLVVMAGAYVFMSKSESASLPLDEQSNNSYADSALDESKSVTPQENTIKEKAEQYKQSKAKADYQGTIKPPTQGPESATPSATPKQSKPSSSATNNAKPDEQKQEPVAAQESKNQPVVKMDNKRAIQATKKSEPNNSSITTEASKPSPSLTKEQPQVPAKTL